MQGQTLRTQGPTLGTQGPYDRQMMQLGMAAHSPFTHLPSEVWRKIIARSFFCAYKRKPRSWFSRHHKNFQEILARKTLVFHCLALAKPFPKSKIPFQILATKIPKILVLSLRSEITQNLAFNPSFSKH